MTNILILELVQSISSEPRVLIGLFSIDFTSIELMNFNNKNK